MTAGLISTDALAQRLGDPRLRILDASWHMPAENRNARKEFEAEHIPGARFFDIDEISDRSSPYPHMLPAPAAFSAAVSALGIHNEDEIVIYDAAGIFSAPRVWWMFRVMGHDRVGVLDGGLPKWKAEKRPLQPGKHETPAGGFTATFRPELLRTRTQVQANIANPHELVMDARSPGRFSGSEPEPRPGLKSGHIEGSKNLFFREVLTPHGTLKPAVELEALLEAKGLASGRPLVATCGSGVTACILALALFTLGNEGVAVYDGAWAEWGSQPLTK